MTTPTAAEIVSRFVPTAGRPLQAGDLAVVREDREYGVRILEYIPGALGLYRVRGVGLDTTAPRWGEEWLAVSRDVYPAF